VIQTPAPPSTDLADGQWHRLHPATPLLRGGFTLIAIAGILFANLRDRIVEVIVGGSGSYEGDPIDFLVEHGLVGAALLVVAVVLVLITTGFYLSWRMHTFRITRELVEVRSGILFRTNRQGRLDRIQGINIVRPFIARVFGAAKLEVNVAGQNANVQLAYLGSAAADGLRRDILRLASGTSRAEATRPEEQHAGLIDERLSELLGPELDPDAAPPESVVQMHVGRLAGSIALSDTSLVFFLLLVVSSTGAIASGEPIALLGLVPMLIALAGFLVSRFLKSLRYSIAGTPDGVRVGFGLFTTSNETLPPGRVHSIEISQPLLWRPLDWWMIKVNRAAQSSTDGANGQQNTTILPVGSRTDARRVLALLAPPLAADDALDFVMNALVSRGGDDGFVNSPARARPIRWFSWRRNGYVILPGAILLRKGGIWRELVVIPAARAQSVSLSQGPLLRRMRLASVHVHTVAGPISARLGAVADTDAGRFFFDVAAAVIDSAETDRTHRWRADE